MGREHLIGEMTLKEMYSYFFTVISKTIKCILFDDEIVDACFWLIKQANIQY